MKNFSHKKIISLILLFVLLVIVSVFLVLKNKNSNKNIWFFLGKKTNNETLVESPFISEIEAVTKEINTRQSQETSDDKAVKDLRIRRWKLMDNNHKDVENYLTQSRTNKSNEATWKSIFDDYVFLKLGNRFGELPTDMPGASIIDAFESWDGFDPFRIDSYYRKDGSVLFILSDMVNSGVYNIFSTTYMATFMGDSSVIVEPLPYLDSEAHVQKDITNAIYDKETDQIKVYGMRPFGLYPCNSVETYTIFNDRLILDTVEEKRVCIGKKIDSVNDLGKYFDDSTDFSLLKIVSKTTSEQLEKVKKVDVTK
ncbi:MAG: hypothetical protein WC444_02805 [Candidatus Paceibacterota bacterium]